MAGSRKRMVRIRHALYVNSTSLKNASIAKHDDAAKMWGLKSSRYVVSGWKAAKFSVSDFDAVQRRWYPPAPGINHPCSVDALHLGADDVWYAIEFKIGCVDSSNLARKIHETVMGCKENLFGIDSALASYDFYRENMVYLIVATELELQNSRDKTFYRTFSAYKEPWNHPSFPQRWHTKALEGIVVSKVYELSPSMFARFVKVKRWY